MADTFDSRLKLRLQESGANSGQWGTLLNQTITNIASVFGFGTHQLTSDADATLTLSDDGASLDALKSSYLKITSSVSLTATRTLTFAPNTLNQVKYIENATTGSQSLVIKQGSGATVSVASGKTAVVYFTGSGSGAAVVDALAGVDPGVTDTLAEVLSAGNATGGTDIAVGTGDDITFADSSKAIFGAGSDLEIYHTASGDHSIIEEVGGGNLVVRTNGPHIEFDKGSTEYMARMLVDGAVELYYDSALKLATTSTGIDVTGSVTADGLDLGTTTDAATVSTTASDYQLQLGAAQSTTGDIGRNISFGISGVTTAAINSIDGGSSNAQTLAFFTGNASALTKRLSIDSIGDISFFDTSGNAAVFFDASAAALGIGTSSPTERIHIHRTSGTGAYIRIQDASGGNYIGTDGGVLQFLDGSGLEKMRISGGKLGIGDTNPAAPLSVSYTSNFANPLVETNAGVNIEGSSSVRILMGTNPNSPYEAYIQASNNGSAFPLLLNPSGGNVGIGTSSPAALIHGMAGDLFLTANSTAANSGQGVYFQSTTSGWTTASAHAAIFGKRTDASNGYLRFDTRQSGTTQEAMRIDSSGNVGIGATSVFSKLHVEDTDWSSGSPYGTVAYILGGNVNDDNWGHVLISQDSTATGSGGKLSFGSNGDNPIAGIKAFYAGATFGHLDFYTRPSGGTSTQRMRIDSSGNLLVGVTSISDATSRTYGNAFAGSSANPNWKSWGNGSHTHAQFRNGTSVVGSITTTSSATAYNQQSDQRLKDNITDAEDAGELIDAIQVRQFDWKVDGEHQRYGMVAQELTTVAPEAVWTPEDPNEMMGVDYSKLVPMLIKEIQTLRSRVAQLEQ